MLRSLVPHGCCLLALGALACSSSDVEPSTPSQRSNVDQPSTPSGQSPDACASALICDDFEAQTTGAPPAAGWTANQNGGTLSVDSTRAFSGTKALLASAPAAPGYRSVMAYFSDATKLPVASNVIYGRMMFFLDSAPTTSMHWTIVDGSGQVPAPEGSYTAIYRYGGQLPVNGGTQLMANYETPDHYSTAGKGPSTDCYQQAPGELAPIAQWACAEWQFDGANNAMRFWLDGREVTALAIDGTGEGCLDQPAGYTWTAPPFTRIGVGWESYQADDARSLWIDDVAISEQRVGCPSAASPTTPDDSNRLY
jgi:hypothetical protein